MHACHEPQTLYMELHLKMLLSLWCQNNVVLKENYTDKYFHINMIQSHLIEHMLIGFIQTMVVFIIK